MATAAAADCGCADRSGERPGGLLDSPGSGLPRAVQVTSLVQKSEKAFAEKVFKAAVGRELIPMVTRKRKGGAAGMETRFRRPLQSGMERFQPVRNAQRPV